MQSLSPRSSSNQTQTPKQSTNGKQTSERILHSNKPKQSNHRSKIKLTAQLQTTTPNKQSKPTASN